MLVLSLTGRRILDRLEVELARHGGKDNGSLPVTHDQFRQLGIHHHAIGPGLRELAALGLIEITEHGSAGNAGHRRPNQFRLTYRPTEKADPSDEWSGIATVQEAEIIAKKARIGRLQSGARKSNRQCRNAPVGPVPKTGRDANAGNQQ